MLFTTTPQPAKRTNIAFCNRTQVEQARGIDIYGSLLYLISNIGLNAIGETQIKNLLKLQNGAVLVAHHDVNLTWCKDYHYK